MAGSHHSDQKLVAGVRAGDPSCVGALLALAEETIWPAVVALVGEGPGAFESFPSVIRALSENGFQRLAGYDGRSSLATFLVLVTRDLLGEEARRLLATDPNRAWRGFDRLFARDIRRKIRGRFPRADEASQNDLFQEVSYKLIDDNYRRIRLYDGKGSFFGYVLMVVDRLLIDMMRRETSRRRLPAEIARMSKLHQLLYVAGAWRGIPIDLDRMAEAISGKITPSPDRVELKEALEGVVTAIMQSRANVAPQEVSLGSGDDDSPELEIASDELNPEEKMMKQQQEETDQAVVELVQRKAKLLPADLQLYLQVTLQEPAPKPRVIARQMAVPVEEIYKLKEKQKAWMKQIGIEARNMAAGPSSHGRSLKPA